MPRLEAEEAIHQATIIGIGTGSMKKEDHRRVMAEWKRKAMAGKKKQPLTLASLAAPGLPIVEVKKHA